MFDEMTPNVISNIQTGIGKGIEGISTGEMQMEDAIKKMEEGQTGIGQGIAGMEQAVNAQKVCASNACNRYQKCLYRWAPALPPNMTIADMIPSNVKASIPQAAIDELAKLKSADDLNAKNQ